MKKNVKIAIIVAIIIFVPLGSVALLLLLKNKKENETDEDLSSDTSAVAVYPLKQGSKGTLVGSLQTKLNAALNQASLAKAKLPTLNGKTITSLVVDRDFGAKTAAVVKWHFGTDSVTQAQYKTL